MSPPVAAPPPPSRKRKEQRGPLAWVWAKPETRSIKVGVLATILVHLIFLILAPELFKAEPLSKDTHRRATRLNIHFVQQPPPQPKPEDRQLGHFVEANPNAPENKPDHTKNFSDRNQQVAQPKPTPKGHNDHPALVGRKDIQSDQIVDGRLTKPQPKAPEEQRPVTPQPPTKKAVKREQNPLSGQVKDIGDNPTGFGSDIARANENNRPVENHTEGSKDAPLNGAAVTQPQIDPRHPRPRPVLEQYSRPAIFANNEFGTENMGVVAVDSRFNSFGAYLTKLVDIVQIEWDNILNASNIYPSPGSTVTIKFTINSKGEISHIDEVHVSSGMTDAAEKACEAGITTRSPYDPWTDDMVAMLGTEQQLIFTFLYE